MICVGEEKKFPAAFMSHIFSKLWMHRKHNVPCTYFRRDFQWKSFIQRYGTFFLNIITPSLKSYPHSVIMWSKSKCFSVTITKQQLPTSFQKRTGFRLVPL
jgi:hypothetical protein